MQLSKRLAALQRLGLFGRLMLLCVPLLLTAVILLPLGFALSGWIGFAAAFTALVSCLVGGLMATAIGLVFHGPQAALQELLLGMLFRMGVPLGATVLVLSQIPSLDEAGFIFYLLPFFFISLAVHACLAVGASQTSGAQSSHAGADSTAAPDGPLGKT
ncbi:MAG: hypothetical protein MPJ50_05805 [Pirellulales bacterium]|nr:hypothetical protein [Pirellulales bacterium]